MRQQIGGAIRRFADAAIPRIRVDADEEAFVTPNGMPPDWLVRNALEDVAWRAAVAPGIDLKVRVR